MSVDLGTGDNALTLADGGNTGTVSNVRHADRRHRRRYHHARHRVSNGSIDLGGGSDTLTLANGTNTATVANIETIIGGTGADTITLGTALTTGMSVDLGTGSTS